MLDDNSNRRSELIRLEGTVEDIIYKNDESGYTVCAIQKDKAELTLVGTMPMLAEGDEIVAMGSWTVHPTYGKQFRVEYFEKALPDDENSMRRYLSSGSVRGIGPRLAARIVDRFRETTFDVIENSPELLCEIKGISPKKARSVSEAFREQFGVRNVMMFFGGFFGAATSVRIYKRWGSASIDIVKSNPYVLCDEIYGIGFERADRLALELGLTGDDEARVEAGIKYILRFNAASNGHCYLPHEKLISASAKMLGCEAGRVDSVCGAMIMANKLSERVYNQTRAIYNTNTYVCETFIARKLITLSNINLTGTISDIDALIAKAEEESGIAFAPMQRKAIVSAIENSVTIITGGPGTGKTTIIKAILSIFSHVGIKASLAAPTGRAAKRMSEATSTAAKTIHRLLGTEFSPDEEATFTRNENNLLEADAIILDELSMADVYLFSAFLKAVKPGARLVLIGDADQLPSVGAGNILNDVIKSNRFSVCRLNEIFRQQKDSYIVINAHKINNGEYPVIAGKESNFFFIQTANPAETAKKISELLMYRLPRTYGEEIQSEIQVITSTKKGVTGTKELNVLLQSILNPPSQLKEEHKYRDVVFREGDKVMQIRNNYDITWEVGEEKNKGTGIFNGDIGYVESVDGEEMCLNIRFDDNKLCAYDFNLLDELEHAYAITVHKSQGSEYPIVILPMNTISSLLCTRNLLYTAVTRAKQMIIIVGSAADLRAMVDNNRQAMRYTGLTQLLSE